MIKANRVKEIKGFTLVEVLFAITIGLLLLSAIYMAVHSGQKSSIAIEAKTSAQQDVRAALELMAMEIGMASYNPKFAPNIWRSPADCTSQSANQSYKGIQAADRNSITVEMDINDNGSVAKGQDNPNENENENENEDEDENENKNKNEIINYVYDTVNQQIKRSTNCDNAFEFLGCTDANGDGRCDINNTIRTVRVINNTIPINNGNGMPAIFRYYDGSGTEIYPDTNPLVIPNIRRIDITLAVETNEIDPNTGQRRRMIYSTSVIPRNHAIP